MPAARPPHPNLIEYCATDHQAEMLRLWLKHGSAEKSASELGIEPSNIHHVLRRVRANARKAGYDGFMYFDEDANYEPKTLKLTQLHYETITVTQEHKLKRQVTSLKSEIKELSEKLTQSEDVLNLLDQAGNFEFKPPSKARRKKSKKPIVAAAAMLSDTHFDEVVSLEEMGGTNEYNRVIATRRLDNFFTKTILMSQDYMAGFQIEHLDLPLGGDLVGGNIHEELARSNDAEIMETVDYWAQEIAKGFVYLSREFKTIYVPCVVGNHGRNTRKPRMKGRVADNFDFLLCRTVANMLKLQGVDNVTFDIPFTFDIGWKTYGWQFYMEHGDATRGGSGWGGMFSPLMRLHDKRLTSWGHIDYHMVGHWHQYRDLGHFLVNGSLKGYDEYARINGFRPEPPQQAYWLTSPEHGKIVSAGIFVDE